MTEKYTKRQHYIPQFYLKRFTDEEGYLHVYDMENKKYFHTAPINFGCENNLYETPISTPNKLGEQFLLRNDIENTFARYEGEFASFLNRLDHICTRDQNPNALILDKEEKEILYRLIANLLFRHPYMMDYMQLDNAEKVDSDFIEIIDNILKYIPICTTSELIEAAAKKTMLTEELENNNILQFVDSIRKLHFMFIYSASDHFITSSFPITIGEDKTILDKEKTCIHFTLSPSLSVMIGNYNEIEKLHNHIVVIHNNQIIQAFNNQKLKPILDHKTYIVASAKEDLMRCFES